MTDKEGSEVDGEVVGKRPSNNLKVGEMDGWVVWWKVVVVNPGAPIDNKKYLLSPPISDYTDTCFYWVRLQAFGFKLCKIVFAF